MDLATRRRRGDRMWVQLGWFSGLVCAGSVAGAIAWGVFVPATASYYEAVSPSVTNTAQQIYALFAIVFQLRAVFLIFVSLEFLCLILAKVLLLGRLSEHASNNYSQAWHMDDGAGACDCIGEYALEKLHRAISAAVVAASVAGVLACVVAAAYDVNAADLWSQSAAACDALGNDTNSSMTLRKDAINVGAIASTAVAVQAVLETIALVIMSGAYMVFIPVCVAMFGRSERRLIRILGQIEYKLDHSTVFLPAEYSPQAADGAANGRRFRMSSPGAEIPMRCDKGKELLRATLAVATVQRRRFVAACAIVLLTFFLRASFNLLNAYASFNAPYNKCGGLCDPCQSQQFLIATWLQYTPEFRAIVVAMSSPLPLVMSLWLMMTKVDRMQLVFPATNEHAQTPSQDRDSLVASLQNMAIEMS